MPAFTCCRNGRLSVVAILVLIATACGGQTKSPSNGPATAATTAAATSAASGPMTENELVWLEGVAALHKTMDKIVQDSPSALTSVVMRSLADKFAGCTPSLDQLGQPTDRLRPVYDLAKQGCTEYEKAGECFATAASLGVVVKGSAEDKTQTAAINCGFASPGDGSRFFAEAEIKGFEVKNATN